jgi:hypothetical protein
MHGGIKTDCKGAANTIRKITFGGPDVVSNSGSHPNLTKIESLTKRHIAGYCGLYFYSGHIV